jgi:hypothetical protein
LRIFPFPRNQIKPLELKMADNQENDLHFPRIYTLHSQKGGVGKTSIALAIAGFAAFHNDKKALIIDADLTGTSLLDIPRMVGNDDKPYFNNLILAKPSEFEKHTPIISDQAKEKAAESMSRLCWNIPKGDGKIFCMPGSPLAKDMQEIVPLISQEDHLKFFRHRLEDVLVTATLADFEVIIVDHSPGLLGLSKSSLLMVIDQAVSHYSKEQHPYGPTRLDRLYRAAATDTEPGRMTAYTILVSTFDPVDYRILAPSFSFILKEELEGKKAQNFVDALPGRVDMIFNKAPVHLKPDFDAVDEIPKILEEIRSLPDRQNVHERLIDYFDARVKKVGADAAEYVVEFEMARVLDAVRNLKTKQEPEYAGWENWCKHVGKSVRLYKESHVKLLARQEDHEKDDSQR